MPHARHMHPACILLVVPMCCLTLTTASHMAPARSVQAFHRLPHTEIHHPAALQRLEVAPDLNVHAHMRVSPLVPRNHLLHVLRPLPPPPPPPCPRQMFDSDTLGYAFDLTHEMDAKFGFKPKAMVSLVSCPGLGFRV